MTDYVPQAGTIPARVVDYFSRRMRGHEVQTGVLVDELDQPSSSIITSCRLAIEQGLVKIEKREGRLYWSRGPAAPALSLTDVPAHETARLDRALRRMQRAVPPRTPADRTPAPNTQPAGQPAHPQEAEAAKASGPVEKPEVEGEGHAEGRPSQDAQPPAGPAPRANTAHPCDSSTPPARPTRFALWSDGQLVIDRAAGRVELSTDETRGLLDYLDRLREVSA